MTDIETAFRRGFSAGWGAAKAENIYSLEREEQEAWDEYQRDLARELDQ